MINIHDQAGNFKFVTAGYDVAVPNRIRELRLERAQLFPAAFSVAALARRMGIGERTIRYWEEGQTRPTARHARRLAREFGVPIEELGLDGLAPEAEQPAQPLSDRAAQRRAWARQSRAADPPKPKPPTTPGSGRPFKM